MKIRIMKIICRVIGHNYQRNGYMMGCRRCKHVTVSWKTRQGKEDSWRNRFAAYSTAMGRNEVK